METESREGRKKLSVVPMGLNNEERKVPSVKTLGYFQFGPGLGDLVGPVPAQKGLGGI